jgi:hypothetical protein
MQNNVEILQKMTKMVLEEAEKNTFDFSNSQDSKLENMMDNVYNRVAHYLARHEGEVILAPRCIMKNSKIYIVSIDLCKRPVDIDFNIK